MALREDSMLQYRRASLGPIALGLLALLGPDRAEGQVAFAPGIGTIPDGIALTAVPAVSADRRYVRLSIDASFQTVDGFTTLPVPFGVSGLGTGTGLGALGGIGAGGAGGNAGGGNLGGLGGVAGAAMGMNGPATGPAPSGLAQSGARPPWAGPPALAAAADSSAGSFDSSFRAGPTASPARKAAKAVRSPKSTRTRSKPAGR